MAMKRQLQDFFQPQATILEVEKVEKNLNSFATSNVRSFWEHSGNETAAKAMSLEGNAKELSALSRAKRSEIS